MMRGALLVAVLALVMAPAALGQRDGTDGEYAQIARALGSHENCVIVRVSTVNRKWAAVKSSYAAGCGPAGGILRDAPSRARPLGREVPGPRRPGGALQVRLAGPAARGARSSPVPLTRRPQGLARTS